MEKVESCIKPKQPELNLPKRMDMNLCPIFHELILHRAQQKDTIHTVNAKQLEQSQLNLMMMITMATNHITESNSIMAYIKIC